MKFFECNISRVYDCVFKLADLFTAKARLNDPISDCKFFVLIASRKVTRIAKKDQGENIKSFHSSAEQNLEPAQQRYFSDKFTTLIPGVAHCVRIKFERQLTLFANIWAYPILHNELFMECYRKRSGKMNRRNKLVLLILTFRRVGRSSRKRT